MQLQPPEGPFCQSCSMPMQAPEDFGTNADGGRSEEYCCYCFQSGEFTDPDITLEGMIDRLAALGAEKMGMAEDQARQMATEVLPRLKRWQAC
jgi:hypothetical protein